MRRFNSLSKNLAYTAYRIVNPILDPIDTIKGIIRYPGYVQDLIQYAHRDHSTHIHLKDIFPILRDKTSLTPFDAHYYFQTIWFLRKIILQKPKRHVDIGSAYQVSGILSLMMKSEFVDIRPIDTKLNNLKIVRGDILHMPYPDNSIPSLSSLHVVEHIGLGRYGDTLDPDGSKKAIKEMVRVVQPNGYIYLSLPIGSYRICFNAHRIHTPGMIIRQFAGCQLIEFSVVNDEGHFHEKADWRKYGHLHYGCGLFIFRKSPKMKITAALHI